MDNKKGRAVFDPAFTNLENEIDLLFEEFLSPISYESNQTGTKKEHGSGFGDSSYPFAKSEKIEVSIWRMPKKSPIDIFDHIGLSIWYVKRIE